jgi:hypothetical protein
MHNKEFGANNLRVVKRRSGYTVPCAWRTGIFYLLCLGFVSFSLALLASYGDSYAEDNPLDKMRDETVAFFKPMSGKITAVDGGRVTVDIGVRDSVKAGMRFTILREEAAFRHPVTKQPLGNLESLIGQLEISEAGSDKSYGSVIQGTAKDGDKIRISEVKVNLLFCQSKDTDWQMADSYHRKLKETDRFNIIDTDLESDNPSEILNEAKRLKADVALNLISSQGASGAELLQRLFYVSDGRQFSEIKAGVNAALAKDLRFGEEFFKTEKKDASLELDLPMDAKLIATGDIDADGKKEILLSNGKEILFYNLGSDLQPALGGLTIKSSALDDHLWLDTIDLNGNGRDEVVVTSMKGDEIISYIYELKGPELVLLFQEKGFLRRLDKGLIGQAYSRAEGYDGAVSEIFWDGTYKKGPQLKLPVGINIYDFVYLNDSSRGRLTVAYDEKGYVNIYDGSGLKLWQSKTKTGGFLTSFPRPSPSTGPDKGDWTVKDRLIVKDSQVLSVERTPLLKMVKGLGYRNSRIKDLRWNGLSAEDNVLIDDISGPLFDYTVAGDTVIVLTGPLFGIKPGNIMKGENPIKTELYIYPLKRK